MFLLRIIVLLLQLFVFVSSSNLLHPLLPKRPLSSLDTKSEQDLNINKRKFFNDVAAICHNVSQSNNEDWKHTLLPRSKKIDAELSHEMLRTFWDSLDEACRALTIIQQTLENEGVSRVKVTGPPLLSSTTPNHPPPVSYMRKKRCLLQGYMKFMK